ncbi:fanconi-associated nuclease 1-like [Haliotis rubra]|uniref:fanconi-associated nuclease 1-like n=1 Tax=Haliotis rubra TaxID=36100 RepID=UPI001EE4F5FE|nr:fanconi-associated nuclease 1-like [Haliotis rubra]XP_046545714.1 fanconi-associated nuclease 1-like [Haliotis rubra]
MSSKQKAKPSRRLKSPKQTGKSKKGQNQTVLSMFKNAKTVSKPGDKRKSSDGKEVVVLSDHEDDDFATVKVQSKSKYFKSRITNEDDPLEAGTGMEDAVSSNDGPPQQPSTSRRLSLRLRSASKRSLSDVGDLQRINLEKDNEPPKDILGSSQKENETSPPAEPVGLIRRKEDGEIVTKQITASKESDSLQTHNALSSSIQGSDIKLSPSKKLSLMKRSTVSGGNCVPKEEKKTNRRSLSLRQNTSTNPVIDLRYESTGSSASITDDGSDDDFVDSTKKRKLSLPPLKKSNSTNIQSQQKLKMKESVSNQCNSSDMSEVKAKFVSSNSRENSKMLWNKLFQSKKKVEEKLQVEKSCDKNSTVEKVHSEKTANLTGDGTVSEGQHLGTEHPLSREQQAQGDGAGVLEKDEEDDRTGTSEKTVEDPTADTEDTEDKGEGKYRVPYYLDNFRTVLTAVLADEDNCRLLDDVDNNCIKTFNTLSESGQKLYVRLFSRKLSWLPVGKISYPEIGNDLTTVLQELVDAGMAMSESSLDDLEQTLKVMSAGDLKTLAKSFHINGAGLTKPQTCDALLKKSKQSTVTSMFGGGGKGAGAAMLGRAKKLLGRSFRLLDGPRRVFVRLLMLFSVIHSWLEEDQGSGGQTQLYHMLLVNMGKVVYPQFKVNKQTSLIRDREGLLRFERAMQCDNDLSGCVDKNNWAGAYSHYLEAREDYLALMKNKQLVSFDKSLPFYLRSCTAGSVLTKVLNQGIEIVQRRKDYPAAVALIEELLGQDVYCNDYRGYWWERLALNLEVHLKKPQQALEAISKGLADPCVKVGHRLALYLRAEKLCTGPNSKYRHRMKKFSHDEVIEAPKQTLEGRVLPHSIPGLKLSFMTEDSYVDGNSEDVTVCAVEELVLGHYKNHGYPEGLHAEGSIISNLFNLYFWDVVFMDVPDAFHSPYQTQPLDFHSNFFYTRRQEAIDTRLQELEEATEEALHDMMAATWNDHNGEMCAGLNWERFKSLEHAQGLVSCIGGKKLAGMMRRYAMEPRHTRSGFPDLTLWNTDTKTFKICEVKGPGDRLSHKQILWLDALLKLGVDAEVCYVKAVGAKKLKPVASTSTS